MLRADKHGAIEVNLPANHRMAGYRAAEYQVVGYVLNNWIALTKYFENNKKILGAESHIF